MAMRTFYVLILGVVIIFAACSDALTVYDNPPAPQNRRLRRSKILFVLFTSS